MPSGYGVSGAVLVNFQSAFGTQNVSSLFPVPIISEGISNQIEQIVESNMYNRFEEAPYHSGAQSVSGSISMEPLPAPMGFFLKSVMGTVETTSDTGLQRHVFVLSDVNSEFSDRAANQPLTIEVNRSVGSAHLYYDMLANELTLNIANGELLTMDVDFIGAGFSRKEGSSYTAGTDKPFVWNQFSGSYNGYAVTELQDLSLTISNQLEPFHTMTGSKAPYRIKRTGAQQIELSGSMVFSTHSYQLAYENQTENSFVINFANEDSPHNLKIDLPRVRFKTFNPTISDAGLVTADFTAQALWKQTSDCACIITLTNTQTYY